VRIISNAIEAPILFEHRITVESISCRLLEPLNRFSGFVHQAVGAGDVVFGVVKMAKATPGLGCCNLFFGRIVVSGGSKHHGLHACQETASVLRMLLQVILNSADRLFSLTGGKHRPSQLILFQVGVEIGVDGFEDIARFPESAFIEERFAQTILRTIITGVQYGCGLELRSCLFNQPNVDKDQAQIVMGLVQIRIQGKRVLKIVNRILMRKMIKRGPLQPATREIGYR